MNDSGKTFAEIELSLLGNGVGSFGVNGIRLDGQSAAATGETQTC